MTLYMTTLPIWHIRVAIPPVQTQSNLPISAFICSPEYCPMALTQEDPVAARTVLTMEHYTAYPEAAEFSDDPTICPTTCPAICAMSIPI
ncbi:hypothetical protein RRF57_002114 [Xylaria bambusicola]|uniref:Uncharacterized protein n=1 Tax=Xylaria bambusicola TaxID=326684 RepID=A0AAN7UID0_9PEZI